MVSIITERDRHLCGVLAEVRWLDVSRAKKLLPGRAVGEVRNVLDRLSKPPRQLFEKKQWLSPRGMESVYCLTDAGCVEAAQLLDREVETPPRELNAQSLEHHFGLVDIYLALLTAEVTAEVARRRIDAVSDAAERRQLLAGVYARAMHPSWRWTMAVTSTRLPWKQAVGGQAFERHLEPDAVLEFPRSKVRSFIEFETGSHTLRAENPNKPNATEAKLRRYAEYLTGRNPATRTTWYASKYPDGFHPDVTFVEPSERRVQNVKQLVDAWARRERVGQPTFKVRVMTSSQVLAQRYFTYAGVGAPKTAAPVVLNEREVSALREHLEALQRLRKSVTEVGQLPRADSVVTFLNRLKEAS